MVKLISTALFAIALSSFLSNPSQAKSSFKELSKAEFLDAYEEKMEEAWKSFSVLYSRIDPELGDLVPGKEWNDEDRIASACIYDKMEDLGQLDEYATFIDEMDSMIEKIASNENITVLNIGEHEEIVSMTDIDGYTQAMSSCGQLELMSKRMKESGLWEKMMSAAATQMQ